jgi:hypothetical protein
MSVFQIIRLPFPDSDLVRYWMDLHSMEGKPRA